MTSAAFKTRQEIFDMAFIGLRSQGFEFSIQDGKCLYRGENGLRCGIGWCIPDIEYSIGLESNSASAPEVMDAAGILYSDANFADDLQSCHDDADFPADMEMRLRVFASEHNLSVPA